jgi:hypothetical protein
MRLRFSISNQPSVISWKIVAMDVVTRTPRACMNKWRFLAGFENLPWGFHEDMMLLRLRDVVGANWRVIHRQLQRHSVSAIRNRYYQLKLQAPVGPPYEEDDYETPDRRTNEWAWMDQVTF